MARRACAASLWEGKERGGGSGRAGSSTKPPRFGEHRPWAHLDALSANQKIRLNKDVDAAGCRRHSRTEAPGDSKPQMKAAAAKRKTSITEIAAGGPTGGPSIQFVAYGSGRFEQLLSKGANADPLADRAPISFDSSGRRPEGMESCRRPDEASTTRG